MSKNRKEANKYEFDLIVRSNLRHVTTTVKQLSYVVEGTSLYLITFKFKSSHKLLKELSRDIKNTL